jgi:predicted nucleic acid-binding protein
MILIDTSAWIEWLIDSATGAKVAARVPDPEDWLVPTMVQLELSKWLTREQGEEMADKVIAFTQTCQIVPLSSDLAIAAAGLCHSAKLATADAIILATAQAIGAELITCDRHFEGIEGVTYIAK